MNIIQMKVINKKINNSMIKIDLVHRMHLMKNTFE